MTSNWLKEMCFMVFSAPVGQEYLESISDSTLQQYMDMGKVWRCWYVYPPLLHELASKSPDELHELCPELERENAFEAVGRCRPIVPSGKLT